MQPICELHQDRFTRGISRDSIEVANFCVDEVTYGHPDMQRIYLCLEMELTESGKDTDLANLRKLLEQKYHLIPDRMSKFELVLAFTQVPRPLLENNGKSETSAPPINPDDTMATATIKTFQYHFDKMKRNDAGAHQGEDIDYIHDMRVAVRRMRTANRVFADYISANKMKPYGKVLKQTGRVLGVIRDMDVFRENFEGYASEQRIDTRRSTLTAIWNAAYSQARTQLSQYLASESYLDFRNTFDKRVHTVVINTPTTPKVADQMWLILSTQQQQFVSYYQQLSHNPPFPLLGYHQLRIYLKHFRYTIEYFRHILVDKGEETITKTKVVQDHLGALQDAVVASKQLKTVLQWGMWHPPTQPYTLMPHTHQPTADVPAYLNYTESRIDQLITGFPRVWQIYTDFLAKGVLSN
jgi:triphosphatase